MSSILDALKKLEEEKSAEIEQRRPFEVADLDARRELIGGGIGQGLMTVRLSLATVLVSAGGVLFFVAVAIAATAVVVRRGLPDESLSVGKLADATTSSAAPSDSEAFSDPDAQTQEPFLEGIDAAPDVSDPESRREPMTSFENEREASARTSTEAAPVPPPLPAISESRSRPRATPKVIASGTASGEPARSRESGPGLEGDQGSLDVAESAPRRQLTHTTVQEFEEIAPLPASAPRWTRQSEAVQPDDATGSKSYSAARDQGASSSGDSEGTERNSRGGVDSSVLPVLSDADRARLGLPELRVNMTLPASKTRPRGSAVINIKQVFLGQIIGNTNAKLVAVEKNGVAIEAVSTRERFYIPFP
jgi:hypothetical protein